MKISESNDFMMGFDPKVRQSEFSNEVRFVVLFVFSTPIKQESLPGNCYWRNINSSQ